MTEWAKKERIVISRRRLSERNKEKEKLCVKAGASSKKIVTSNNKKWTEEDNLVRIDNMSSAEDKNFKKKGPQKEEDYL